MRRRSAFDFVVRTLVGIVALIVSCAVAPAYAAASCTAEQGQLLIDRGRYKQAIAEFTCVIDAHPTEVEGYLGRIEAQLLLGQYSNSVRDYARVTAVVTPVHPDAQTTILAGYAARLAIAPNNIPALTGASFARWWYFDYLGAIHVLDQLLDLEPANPYGNLFRGSSRLLKGHAGNEGVGDALPAGTTLELGLVPGQTLDIPLVVSPDEKVSIVTSSHDYWDTILVLLDPNGMPVLGSDDSWKYFAAFDWTALASGTYRIRVTFFESVITGTLRVSHK